MPKPIDTTKESPGPAGALSTVVYALTRAVFVHGREERVTASQGSALRRLPNAPGLGSEKRDGELATARESSTAGTHGSDLTGSPVQGAAKATKPSSVH